MCAYQDHPLFQLECIDPAGWDTAIRQLNSTEQTADPLRQVGTVVACRLGMGRGSRVAAAVAAVP